MSEGESEAEGECTAESCDDGVECTDDSRNEESCECSHIQLHARCSQGQICDLDEGCVSPPPCGSVSDCPDPDDPCVVIGCESSTATCTYDPLDSDGDGHAPQVCVSVGGDDCDDSSPCDPNKDKDCDWEDSDGGLLIYPGAEEICDEKDNDCNGETDDLPELGLPCDGDDGDQCAEGVWECWYGEGRGLGCSDNTSTNHELCNNTDDDCDGEIDEDWSLGAPCDGVDGDLCEEGVWVCDDSGGVICSDTTGATVELCNGEDDDCDGLTDNGPPELCNSVDDDCDGETDEDWSELRDPCDGTDGDLCEEGVWVCNGSGSDIVCNDTTDTSVEICDGEDNDCDGITDGCNLSGPWFFELSYNGEMLVTLEQDVCPSLDITGDVRWAACRYCDLGCCAICSGTWTNPYTDFELTCTFNGGGLVEIYFRGTLSDDDICNNPSGSYWLEDREGTTIGDFTGCAGWEEC